MDVCDRLYTVLGCSSVRAMELTSYQLIGVAYEWYKSLLRSRPAGSPILDWFEFYNAFVERFMLESLRDAKTREFELLKQTEGMSVLDFREYINDISRASGFSKEIIITLENSSSEILTCFENFIFVWIIQEEKLLT